MAKKKSAPKKKAAPKKKPAPKKQSRKAAERVLRDGPIRRRPRQERLPGVEEDPGSKAIDNAAFDYVEARDARMAATTQETQRATKLIAVVKRERPGQKVYKHTVGGETIIVKISAKDPTEKVNVKIKPVEEPEIGEGAAGDDEPGDTVAMDGDDEQGDGQGVEGLQVDEEGDDE